MAGGSWRTKILKIKWPRTASLETSLSMNIYLIGKVGRVERRKRLMCLYETEAKFPLLKIVVVIMTILILLID